MFSFSIIEELGLWMGTEKRGKLSRFLNQIINGNLKKSKLQEFLETLYSQFIYDQLFVLFMYHAKKRKIITRNIKNVKFV